MVSVTFVKSIELRELSSDAFIITLTVVMNDSSTQIWFVLEKNFLFQKVIQIS